MDLGPAITAAIEQARPQAQQLADLLGEVIAVLRRPAGASRSAARGDEVAASIAADLADFRDRLLAHPGTFNIVVFGRTSTGKSTLVSALGHSDGSKISASEINKTRAPEKTVWEDCWLWDVPGLNGTDGKSDQDALERMAREKAAIADIVLLCFNTSSTEYKMFEKIAAWVTDLGKPTIAVLNVHHPFWRFEAESSYPRSHLIVSQRVTEHVGYIREGLAKTGLRGIPVVAMNSLDAAYARADPAWEGPFRQAMAARKARAGGTGRLLRWSNLLALEKLLHEAISADAVTLRLGALVREVDGVLSGGAEAISEDVEAVVRAQAAVVERGIARLLNLFGAPDVVLGNDAAGQRLVRAVADVERHRGGGFDAPRAGLAGQHARRLIGAAFGDQREAAHKRADSVIDEAMTHRRKVNHAKFAQTVFDCEEIHAAHARVRTDLAAYVNARVAQAVADTDADMHAVQFDQAMINGKAGRALRRLSVGSKLAASVTSVAAGVLLFQWWNPFGWAAGAVLLTGTIASGAASVIGWGPGGARPGGVTPPWPRPARTRTRRWTAHSTGRNSRRPSVPPASSSRRCSGRSPRRSATPSACTRPSLPRYTAGRR